jgi:hypothetical protein
MEIQRDTEMEIHKDRCTRVKKTWIDFERRQPTDKIEKQKDKERVKNVRQKEMEQSGQ